LADQIGRSFETYGRHTHVRQTTIFGGVRQGPQVHALKAGVDVLVATPGRLLDLMGQRFVHLDRVEVLVLDEADRMLDMGFIRDIRRIVAAVPAKRQTMLFSATMPSSIMHLARSILTEPVEVRVHPEAPAAENVDHAVYLVERPYKQALLEHLLQSGTISRALVFTRTKRMADRVVVHLRHASIAAEAIHSDKTQGARQRALGDFMAGRTSILIASDIAARGLDFVDVSHVINYDMPQDAETYVHRIGRTGRAGAGGTALSFCGLDERGQLASIERLIHMALPTVAEHPFRSAVPRLQRRTAPTKFPASWRRLGHARSFAKKR
jgi:ATP-dependent RNA helicase RhlE